MRIAVDVCIGWLGVFILRQAGHDVLEAEHAETDRDWFARGLVFGADVFVSGDADIEIAAYDANVTFFKVRHGERGAHAAQRLVKLLRRKKDRRTVLRTVERGA